ncbi:MAG: hypothetical protein GY865_16845, partial [candidate division Zixibacteria bacterium]|nr:hypothetical protein [candidate division Zixibacteria bacterium]
MKKALYIAQKAINERALSNIVSSELEMEFSDWENVDDIEKYDLIVIDWERNDDISDDKAVIIRTKCGFRDIPIILAANENEVAEAGRSLRRGANDIIIKPFDEEKVKPILYKSLQPAGNKTQINADFINPFLGATVDVIKTMAGADAEKKDIYLKRSHTLFGDISGVMSLSGDAEGLVAITFQNDLGYYLVANMVGCDPTDLTPEDLHDGIGEIINMISGAAKAVLNEKGNSISIAIPTVIIGFGHQ